MKKDEIEKQIKQSSLYEDFINNRSGKIGISVKGIPIWILKEEIGVKMYYQLPHDKKYDYSAVSDFLKYAIPVLSDLIEKKRLEKLTKSDF